MSELILNIPSEFLETDALLIDVVMLTSSKIICCQFSVYFIGAGYTIYWVQCEAYTFISTSKLQEFPGFKMWIILQVQNKIQYCQIKSVSSGCVIKKFEDFNFYEYQVEILLIK